MIRDIKRKSFMQYLEQLSLSADKNYSLWRATTRLKRPLIRISPILDENGFWIRHDSELVEMFARHLFKIFQPHDMTSVSAPAVCYQQDTISARNRQKF